MKKYVTHVRDEEERKAVIAAIEKAGFETYGGASYTQECLFFGAEKILQQSDVGYAIRTATKKGDVFIEAEDIISDPFQLDGATKPEKTHVIDGKEISESTIKTALSQLFNE